MIYRRYQIEGEGRPGTEKHTFQKPWFSNLMMFIGMFSLFVLYLVFYSIYYAKIVKKMVEERKNNKVFLNNYILLVKQMLHYGKYMYTV